MERKSTQAHIDANARYDKKAYARVLLRIRNDSELAAIENAMLISLGIELEPVCEESEETPPCRIPGSQKSRPGAVSCRRCMTLCWTGSSRLDESIKKPHAARRAA